MTPKARLAAVRGRSILSPLVLGLGIWLGFPTVAALQDVPSLVSGLEAPAARWNAFVRRSVAGSTHAAEMPFVDRSVRKAAWSGAGLEAAGIGAVAFRGSDVQNPVPDEGRVSRGDKRGRIVKIAPVIPPRHFNAGSVFERTSEVLRPGLALDAKMAFVKPDIEGREIAIAAHFHPNVEKPAVDPTVPPMLASLVTSDKADILATAYAPPAPDYAKASPFENLLREADPNGGRFVPPVAPGDHSWMAQPLPPSVFSAPEQRCLATAIYFEARGENLRGQAAVAQVILNRVRSPAYPDTICGVVYQNDSWKNRCQFSFACDGIRDRVASQRNYRVAQDVALAVTAGKIFISDVGSSTHYHATYVNPGWSHTMKKMKQIGLHIFYRTKRGGWS